MRTAHSLLCLAALCACTTVPPKPPVEAKATISYEENVPEPPKVTPPPATRAGETKETLFGREVADPYRWLEDEKAAEVQEWSKAQDAYAREQLKQIPIRDALVKRFKELLYTESVKAPDQRGGRLFYYRKGPQQEKGVIYYEPAEGGEAKAVLDPNKWGREGTLSLGGAWPSWDGKWIAFTQKPNAADAAILRVAADSGGWTKGDIIEGARYATPQWLPDNSGFFYEYTPTDPSISEADRPGYEEIRFHKLGSDPKTDEVHFPALKDPTWSLSNVLSRDGKYLFVIQDRVGGAESIVHVKQLGKDKAFKVLARAPLARFAATEWNGFFYIETNEGAPRGRVFKTAVAHPERKAWKELIPEDTTAALVTSTLVGGKIAVEYIRDVASEIRLFDLNGKLVRTVELPGSGTVKDVSGLPDSDVAYFSFTSYTTPAEVLKLTVSTGKVDVWRKVEVPVQTDKYEVEQVRYPSKDGTEIPMFLVHKKGLAKDGEAAVLLYGYGGFNISVLPSFIRSIWPWLEAGGVYAVPNLRGGGEFGEAWHRAGMLHQKQNVFDDFVAAGKYLVKEGWTKPGHIAVTGASNGGLLVGAAMVQQPDLFGAVACGVPLLDMVRFHLYGGGKTWIPEYGDPAKQEDLEALVAYSPYHAVKRGVDYPALLMLSADHDDRVDPMHARKFVAAVQASGSVNPAWLRIEANAGHGGADQVRQAVQENADLYAFLMSHLNMKYPPAEAPPPAPGPAATAQ